MKGRHLGLGTYLQTGRWSEPETRSDVPSDAAPSPIPTRKQAVQRVGEREALSLGAVYRSVSILATAGAQADFDVYQGSGKSARMVEITSLGAGAMWISQPDTRSSRAAFIEESITSLATRGNFYWLVDRDNQGRVSNLTVLNPAWITITYLQDGTVTAYQYLGAEYAPDRIYQGKLLRFPGEPYGLGPIQAAQRTIRGALDTRDFASSRFDAPEPKLGYLSTDQTLAPPVATGIKTAWTEAMAADNDIAVLGNGVKWNSVLLSPADAQWLESRNFDVTEIARLYGIPASIALAPLEGSTTTYANISQAWTEFARFSLAKYLGEIANGFSMLLPRGKTARVDYEALLAADTSTRFASYLQATGSAWMTVNEIRAREGLDPIDGGDVLATTPAPTTAQNGD
jgi:HK97 family phage portal protein